MTLSRRRPLGTVGAVGRSRSRTTGTGVKRIVRDSYRGLEWYALVKQVWARDRGCVACKLPLGSLDDEGKKIKFDCHHIRKLSSGGTTTLSNLMCLCSKCHEKRHPHMSRR